MIEFLYSIDVNIFYFINQTLSSKFLDKFFLIITDVKHWYITYLLLWLTLFIKGRRIGKIAAVGAIILIAFSDQVSSNFLKDLITRIRPCNALENVKLLLSCKGSYSFPSSHAVNNFALAVFMLRLFPKYKWILLITASFVALSRPYLGLHYPSDILGGAVIGAIIGYIFAAAALKLDKYFDKRKLWES